MSGSLEQSRVMLQFVRQALLDREGEYRLLGFLPAAHHDASGNRDTAEGAFLQREKSNGIEPIQFHFCGRTRELGKPRWDR